MNIDITNKLSSKKSNTDFLQKLGGSLENMKYFSVDRQEGDYTILQNILTKKIFEVKTSKLPPFLNDGDILKKIGFNYEFDFQKTKELQREVREKMNKVLESNEQT